MPPIYDVGFKKFPSLRAKLAKFAVSCWLTSFIHGKRIRNGLNEPREDFIGTRAEVKGKRRKIRLPTREGIC